LIPDQFDRRQHDQFKPLVYPDVRKRWETQDFVPEHALFELMAEYKERLAPISGEAPPRATGVVAYRDACQFADGDARVQVYLNVLTRRLCMCGKGAGAERLIDRLFTRIEENAYCEWTLTENWRPRTEEDRQLLSEWESLVESASKAKKPGDG